MQSKQQGFTLVEIAIVLVIIGLLLGGILKGQELITNAKVRNVADQVNSVKAAYFAFQDRYRALPGDYLEAQAAANIPNVTAGGDGNGQINAGKEEVAAWRHLANAGFISCAQCTTGAGTTPDTTNSPVNAYGGVMSIVYDGAYNHLTAGTGPTVNNLKTGNQIPSNILVEVDRKIDDGNPRTGTLRFSNYSATAATAPSAATCAPINNDNWQVTSPDSNCGAATLF